MRIAMKHIALLVTYGVTFCLLVTGCGSGGDSGGTSGGGGNYPTVAWQLTGEWWTCYNANSSSITDPFQRCSWSCAYYDGSRTPSSVDALFADDIDGSICCGEPIFLVDPETGEVSYAQIYQDCLDSAPIYCTVEVVTGPCR
jgi:hypothetical protein